MFEQDYMKLLGTVLASGELREGRNGSTYALPFLDISFNARHLPLLHSRRTYYKSIAGEYAAFLRGPESVYDFKRFGCNYWDDWGDEEGHLILDYGNEWMDQIPTVIESLKNDPHGRRHLIDAWNFRHLDDLSLPCCHYSYQFYVRENKYLDMLWNQRSADLCVGLPADAVLAAIMLRSFANATGYLTGNVKMSLGDAHIYENHVKQAEEQLYIWSTLKDVPLIEWHMTARENIFGFIPSDVFVETPYIPEKVIKYELNI